METKEIERTSQNADDLYLETIHHINQKQLDNGKKIDKLFTTPEVQLGAWFPSISNNNKKKEMNSFLTNWSCDSKTSSLALFFYKHFHSIQ